MQLYVKFDQVSRSP